MQVCLWCVSSSHLCSSNSVRAGLGPSRYDRDHCILPEITTWQIGIEARLTLSWRLVAHILFRLRRSQCDPCQRGNKFGHSLQKQIRGRYVPGNNVSINYGFFFGGATLVNTEQTSHFMTLLQLPTEQNSVSLWSMPWTAPWKRGRPVLHFGRSAICTARGGDRMSCPCL